MRQGSGLNKCHWRSVKSDLKITSSMKLLRCLLPLTVLALSLTPSLPAEDPQISGDELLRVVRLSQASQDLKHLKGRLRNDNTGNTFPLELTIESGSIRFLLRNPNEIINLDLNQNNSKLTRIVAGSRKELTTAQYNELVRGTDINYEDLSMRFLYWPHAKIIGEDTLNFQKCWIVRMVNPDGRGPYGTVDAWVAKSSGTMMKMEAYNPQGKKLKQFLVRKGQKYKGAYILKQMRVESFNPASGDVAGRTYMEIDDPE